MKTTLLVLAIALLGTAPLAHAAQNCTLKLKGDDRMQYDLKTATVSASCPKITIELTHAGKMPAQAMGHNVVIARTADMNAVVASGMKAGAATGYVPKGDPKVIAATSVVGGGASTKTSFAGNKLKAGGDYMFFCTFPGHAAIMKGTLVVGK
jgi:azurin